MSQKEAAVTEAATPEKTSEKRCLSESEVVFRIEKLENPLEGYKSLLENLRKRPEQIRETMQGRLNEFYASEYAQMTIDRRK